MIRTRSTRLYIASETTAGTQADIADLRSIIADATQPSIEFEKNTRDNATNNFAVPEVPVIAGTTATIEIMMPIYFAQLRRDTGEDATPAHADILLKACGLAHADDDESVVYSPTASPTSCSIAWDQGGRATWMTGCVGSVKTSVEGGSEVMWTFTMTGRIQFLTRAPSFLSNAAAVPTAYRRARPTGAELTVTGITEAGVTHSEVAVDSSVLSVSFEQANEVVRVADITASDGKSLPQITATKPKSEIRMLSPVADSRKQDEFWGLLNSEGLVQLSLKIKGADDDTSLTILLNAASITSGENADNDGLQSQAFSAMGVHTSNNANPFQFTFLTPEV